MSGRSYRRARANPQPVAAPSSSPGLPGASNQSLLAAIRGGARGAFDETPTLSAMPKPHGGGHSPAAALAHAAGHGGAAIEASHAATASARPLLDSANSNVVGSTPSVRQSAKNMIDHVGHDTSVKGGDLLAPVSMITGLKQLFGASHAESAPEAVVERAAGAAEAGSGAIGTLGLAGKLLGWKGASGLAAKASPIGAVLGAFSSGHSLGSSGNRGIEKLGWLGKQSAEYGDPKKNANWSDKAADAGRWTRKKLGGGRLGQVAGGVATLGASVPLAMGAAVTGVGNTLYETGQALNSGRKWVGDEARDGLGRALGWPSVLEAAQAGMPPDSLAQDR